MHTYNCSLLRAPSLQGVAQLHWNFVGYPTLFCRIVLPVGSRILVLVSHIFLEEALHIVPDHAFPPTDGRSQILVHMDISAPTYLVSSASNLPSISSNNLAAGLIMIDDLESRTNRCSHSYLSIKYPEHRSTSNQGSKLYYRGSIQLAFGTINYRATP